MAVIRIKNKDGGGVPSSLTQGELAVNLADRSLYVGGVDTLPIFLSGVQSFNGKTGAVEGASLGANTFDGLNHFQAGISAAGATIGTLIVHDGISASGGITFQNDLWVGGLLTVVGGMEASGGITFANTVYVGETLSVETDISYNGKLVRGGIPQYTMQSVGTTSDLKNIIGVTTGDVVYVNGPEGWDGLYVLRLNTTTPPLGPVWTRLNGNVPSDVNGDGIVDSYDLSAVLAAWGQTQETYAWSGTPMQIGIVDGNNSSFEIKVYGATVGKKTSALKITSDDAVPQIFMNAGTVNVDGGLVVKDLTSGINQVLRVEGSRFSSAPLLRVVGAEGITGGYSLFQCGVVFDGGTGSGMTFSNSPVTIGSLLTLNGGLSAGCGVTFNCLVNFTKGLSASGATLGTLVVNGGSTFSGPVYMGATLTMNSNIQLNEHFKIVGGLVDGGVYT